MNAPRLLDLFAGAGGCSVGYRRAGFDVTAVDIAPMHNNPTWDLHQGDALDWLADPEALAEFAVIHASPPCQAWTILRTRWPGRDYPTLIEPVREALEAWTALTGGAWVIENVPGSPIRDPLILCGTMFGLGLSDLVLKRHRLFESNRPLSPPGPCACSGAPTIGVYGHGGGRIAPGGGGVKAYGAEAAEALGVDWTTHQPELAQMIPPAYAEWIGRQLLADLRGEAAPSVEAVS